MKVRNYEKTEMLFLGIAIILLIEVIGIIWLYRKKEFTYQTISSIVQKKDYVIVMVNTEEKQVIYHNQILYFKNQKKLYEIVDNHGKMMTKNNKDYYELVLKFSFPNKYKEKDILELVIPEKKYRRIEMIKKILGGG